MRQGDGRRIRLVRTCHMGGPSSSLTAALAHFEAGVLGEHGGVAHHAFPLQAVRRLRTTRYSFFFYCYVWNASYCIILACAKVKFGRTFDNPLDIFNDLSSWRSEWMSTKFGDYSRGLCKGRVEICPSDGVRARSRDALFIQLTVTEQADGRPT